MRIKSFKIKLAVLSLSAFLLLGTALTTPSSASEPFLGEIMTVGFNFAPRGWAFCDGQILPINQYQSLYSLLGTMYGGGRPNKLCTARSSRPHGPAYRFGPYTGQQQRPGKSPSNRSTTAGPQPCIKGFKQSGNR